VRVEVRLYATLVEHVESARAGDPLPVEIRNGAMLTELLDQLGIAPGDVHLSIVNGRPIHDMAHELTDGDRVGLFPPTGGG